MAHKWLGGGNRRATHQWPANEIIRCHLRASRYLSDTESDGLSPSVSEGYLRARDNEVLFPSTLA